jgi:hypothetical protein
MKLLDLYLVGKVDGSKVGEADLWPVMGMVEQVGKGRTVSMRLTVEEVEESVPLTATLEEGEESPSRRVMI